MPIFPYVKYIVYVYYFYICSIFKYSIDLIPIPVRYGVGKQIIISITLFLRYMDILIAFRPFHCNV